MRTRIIRRFLWSTFALFLTTLLLVDFYVSRYIRAREKDNFRHQLRSVAQILSDTAVTGWQDWTKAAARRAHARVAVVNAAGTVIADSEPDAPTPEDGPNQAVISERMGDKILRLSAPVDRRDTLVAGFHWGLLEISCLSIALALAMGYIFMRSFSTRIKRLRTYVEGLPDAPLDEELPAAEDELGALASSLRHTAAHIRDLLGRLKLESARREAILGGMVEGVLAVDNELRVTFCNDSFARGAGARTPVPEGMPLVQLVRDPGLIDILSEVLAKGQSINRRLQLRSTKAHTFEVQAAPLAGPTAGGALAILHDITELERLERIRKDFVANVSHELRTPLASIRGYAETLLDGALEDEENNRKFVEIIFSQAIRLNNIAADLLTLSELESAGATMQPKRISVRTCLEGAVRTVESTARVSGVALVTGKIDDLYVLGHQIRLEQALINLLDNAVKFNRPNGEVRIEAGEIEGGNAAIWISDTGVGIPANDLPRVFERFYRVDKARSRAVGGTGLGLSIVRHVIEQMGGSVQVESQLGKGSKFTLRIPCESPSGKLVPA